MKHSLKIKFDKMKNITYISLALLLCFSACKNQDWEFPDFEYQTVYFAHQYPVRTITLGEDLYDTTLDNEGKFEIMATTGGVYENPNDVYIDVEVDNSQIEDLLFANGENDILPMPASHYVLASDRILIPKGQIVGGVEVELTDAFFADSMAIERNYVIALKMTNVENADTILSGVPLGTVVSENPKRAIATNWEVQPKDFTFYAVKYINPWHGIYLRRGTDIIKGKNGNTSLDQTILRHEEFVENDEVTELNTHSFTEVRFPVVLQDADGVNVQYPLLLKHTEDGNFTIEADSEDFVASGNAEFVKDGEKNSWGNMDRDAFYMTYEIESNDLLITSTDTLVMRNRGVSMETFSPVLK